MTTALSLYLDALRFTAAWRWRSALPPISGIPLAFGAVVVLVGFESLDGRLLFEHMHMPYSAYDYIVGALVAIFIVGLANTSLPMPGATVARLVRYLAGTTFGLYLLHNPLLIFFGTVIPGSPERLVRRILLFGLTLGGSILIAHLIERRKGAFKRALRFGLDTLRGRPCAPFLSVKGFLDYGQVPLIFAGARQSSLSLPDMLRKSRFGLQPPEREPPAKIHTGSVRSRDALISGGIGSAGARSDVSPGIWFGGPAGGDRTSPLYPSPCAARRASASPLLPCCWF